MAIREFSHDSNKRLLEHGEIELATFEKTYFTDDPEFT